MSAAGNKTTASTHGMGSGGLAVDAMAIGCLGVERCGERFFVLSHFRLCERLVGGDFVSVCFITAGPITKLCAWGEEESGGHVL